ncbi:MAG: hypothetical protein L3J46_08430, partial [Kangiellaceae bacterium]|nr:hypothetical protein [Kangiellaceae bacterium]
MFKSFFSRLIALFLIFSAPWSFASVNNLEKFSKHDKYRAVKISPDGKYLAISRYFDGESQLLIVDSKTLNPISHNTFKGREEVGDFFWVNEERIVIKVNARHKFHAAPVYYGELYSLNILSNKGEMIFGNRLTFTRGQGPRRKKILKRHEAMGSSWASIIDILPNDKNHILIRAEPYSTNKNKIARLYKLNVNDASIKFVVEEPVPKSWFFSDDEGNLLLAIGTDKSANKVVFEFDKRTSEWTKVKNFQYGNSFAPLIYDEKKRTLILLDDQSHDTRSLYRLDLKTADRELLFHDTRNDISWVEL